MTVGRYIKNPSGVAHTIGMVEFILVLISLSSRDCKLHCLHSQVVPLEKKKKKKGSWDSTEKMLVF